MQVPKWFQKLYWWGDSFRLEGKRDKRVVIVQTINQGNWAEWKWLARAYGKKKLREAIQEIPASEFRQSALKLISLLIGISRMKYVSRSDYITAKRNSQKTANTP